MQIQCHLAHGCVGHDHSWSGATGGTDWNIWYSVPYFTLSSMSLSILSHHTYLMTRDFIVVIPGCPLCSSVRTTSEPWEVSLLVITKICNPLHRDFISFITWITSQNEYETWSVEQSPLELARNVGLILPATQQKSFFPGFAGCTRLLNVSYVGASAKFRWNSSSPATLSAAKKIV